MTVKDLLKKHEGLRLKPYHCTAGKLTIGFGRNLEDKGITVAEAEYLLDNDVAEATEQAKTLVKNWDELSENRKSVLINMTFNMGIDEMRNWRVTLGFIEAGDFKAAAYNMRLSRWFKQVGSRATELIKMMEDG
jgi:lysozyme